MSDLSRLGRAIAVPLWLILLAALVARGDWQLLPVAVAILVVLVAPPLWRRRERRLDDRIVEWLAGQPGGARGLDVCRAVRKGTGTVFPALSRLVREGRLVDDWTVDDGLNVRWYRVPTDEADMPPAPCWIRAAGQCDGRRSFCAGCIELGVANPASLDGGHA